MYKTETSNIPIWIRQRMCNIRKPSRASGLTGGALDAPHKRPPPSRSASRRQSLLGQILGLASSTAPFRLSMPKGANEQQTAGPGQIGRGERRERTEKRKVRRKQIHKVSEPQGPPRRLVDTASSLTVDECRKEVGDLLVPPQPT